LKLAAAALALAALGLPAGASAAGRATDWTKTVVKTAAGGFQMGNPKAKVKLVEYGSMSCPHCRDFDEAGAPKLIDKYVKTGKVSFEFRNYVRDPFDLAAAVVARCNGPKTFFPLTQALFREQESWEDKARSVPEDQLQQAFSTGPDQIAVQAAKFAGFQEWATAQGLPAEKSRQCLANAAEVNGLVKMAADANAKYPNFKGVPAFVINGKMLDDTYDWETLEPKLRKAVGEKG